MSMGYTVATKITAGHRRPPCKTIGHAIALASSGDYIVVAAATYTENLTIAFNLTIAGFGVSGGPVIDGGGHNTVVTISNRAAQVTLSNLTIYHGFSTARGGGIYNNGQLTINNTTVTGNSVVEGYGSGPEGGGIFNLGTLTINNSTISGNSVTSAPPHRPPGYGGGIFSFGTLTINNSTISWNSAVGNLGGQNGGGIASRNTFTTINNSTISWNSAANGGGLYGPATLQNSIVANSIGGGNCYGTMSSDGYNLSSDNSCNFNNTGDLNNTDPLLGPLQNNGGPTQTMALQSGSPAIDAGNPSGCTDGSGHLLTTDQRGMPRPDHEDSGGCDMGAYERQTD
jgi:hypothetical protein